MLQVQLQDAFKAEADTVIQRLKDELRKAGIAYTEMARNDPQTIADADTIQIDVKGVPATKAGNFRQIVNDNFSTAWILTPVNSTDFRMTMQPTYALKLKDDTLTQSINTIEKKINGLGLAESSVQQRGGVDGRSRDPGAAARRGRSGARQADSEDAGGSGTVRSAEPAARSLRAKKRARARAAFCRWMPRFVKSSRAPARRRSTISWPATPVVTGRRSSRRASAAVVEHGGWETEFVLTQDAAKRFETLHGGAHRRPAGDRAG